jgi:hypothetical protein
VELAVGAVIFVVGDVMLVGGEAMLERVAGDGSFAGFGFRAGGMVFGMASG